MVLTLLALSVPVLLLAVAGWCLLRIAADPAGMKCGRPAKGLCQGGPECWCAHGEPVPPGVKEYPDA